MDLERSAVGGLPALVAGDGPPLVSLSGLMPMAGVDGTMMRRTAVAAIEPYRRRRRVHFLNGRPGLPRGMTMADLAAEHADALRQAFGEPVDVLGLSTGGSIAQQLAADHPDVVRRLVLQSTGCRLGPDARELQRRVAARVRAGAYRQAMALFVADLVPPHRGQVVVGALAWALAPAVLPDTRGLHDMATIIEAEDGFDLARCARPIAAPTILVAGLKDRFYGAALLAETAALIPDCRTHLIPGRGHITALAHPSVAPTVLRFLDEAD